MMQLVKLHDKVDVMGLTYPAGREIDELAFIKVRMFMGFPRAMIKEDNLSFHSGFEICLINLHHKCRAKGRKLVQGRPHLLPSASSHGYSHGKNQESPEISC